jgi:hypothetical protein
MPDRELDPVRRPLTDTQRRAIRSKVRHLTTTGRRASTIYLPITAGLMGLLWLWTILASDAPWLVVTAFWFAIGAGIALWTRRDMRTHAAQLEGMAHRLESALTRNEADVYEIRAGSFAVLEEVEDEGACYAFQLEGDQLVFIVGQEFYEAARFPSLDFSLVYPLDEHGNTVDMFIEKRGDRAKPAKAIPSAVKERLDVPQHLEMRKGTVDNLEAVLGQTVAG